MTRQSTDIFGQTVRQMAEHSTSIYSNRTGLDTRSLLNSQSKSRQTKHGSTSAVSTWQIGQFPNLRDHSCASNLCKFMFSVPVTLLLFLSYCYNGINCIKSKLLQQKLMQHS